MTIRQREIFTHYVHIETPGKELCWNFYTRRKNVSFGLFKEVEKPDPSKPVRMVLSTGPGGAAEVVSTTSPTIHSAIRPSVVSSVEPRSSSTSKYKRAGRRIEPPGMLVESEFFKTFQGAYQLFRLLTMRALKVPSRVRISFKSRALSIVLFLSPTFLVYWCLIIVFP